MLASVDTACMHVLMLGSGRLSAGRAAKTARKLARGDEVALFGRFRGEAPGAEILELDDARMWLAGLVGPVLLIHDDATVARRDADEMGRLHELHESLVVPRWKTPGQKLGALVGSPPVLAELTERLTDLSPSSLAGYTAVEAPFEIEHDQNCGLAGQSDSRPLLVASMIVKDEEDHLAACLTALDEVVDRIEIVDTGSSDSTVELARSLGAHVTSAPWTDDFAAARNLALDRCRDAKYVLHVDADERVVCRDPAQFRRYLAESDRTAYRIDMRNVVGGNVTSSFQAVRIFSASGTCWIGRVHEYPAAQQTCQPLKGAGLDGLTIDHFGYEPDVVERKDKLNRNIDLAEAAYRARPSFKSRLDLARSLAWGSQNGRAYELFREAAADMTGASDAAAAFVLGHVALAELDDGEFRSALSIADEAIARCSGEFVAHLARARVWKTLGDDQAIVDAHVSRSMTGLETPMFDTAASKALTNNLTIGAFARLGRYEDAVSLAFEVIGSGRTGFDEWESLAAMPQELRELVLPPLVRLDVGESWVPGLTGAIPMKELSRLVLTSVEVNTPSSGVVVAGIMAGVIAGDLDTAQAIASTSDVLDDDQRSVTAERCRARGAHAVADELERTLTPTR